MKPLLQPTGVLLALSLIISGCQAQAVKPTPPAQPVVEPTDMLAPLQGRFDEMVKADERVEQRITLVQEQLIKLGQQLQALQQRNQQLLQAMQRMQLTQAQSTDKSQPENEQAATDGEEGRPEDRVTELLYRLEQQLAEQQSVSVAGASGAVAGGFRLASAYTPKGQWVIFKYDEQTGLTWNAHDGSWIEVDEQESIPASVYQVVLRPAAGDIKGYVAARIDRETGRSWWLRGNVWEPFQ